MKSLNLGFGYPCSGTCETCNLLHVTIQSASDEQQEKYLKALADYQEKASWGYSLLKANVDVTKKTAGHLLMTFDLMQLNFDTWLNVLFEAAVGLQFRNTQCYIQICQYVHVAWDCHK